MKITKRILLSLYFIVFLFLAVITINIYTHKKIFELTNDTEQAIIIYSKWGQFTNKTTEFLYSTSNQQEKYIEWKESLEDFDNMHTILLNSDHFKSMGYEVEGVIEQINGLWGFYRTLIFDLISDLESEQGKALIDSLEKSGKSFHNFSTIISSTRDPKIKLALKTNNTLSYRRNDSPETSAQSDFNWLINHNFIPLIKARSTLLSRRITVLSLLFSIFGILSAGLIALILAGSIKKPIEQFIETFKRGAYGDFSVRYTGKNVQPHTSNSDEKCYTNSGSFSAALGIPVRCPEIMSGRIRDCDLCPVYRQQNRDEITMLGTWFNILMYNLEHSVNSINNAKNIWHKNQEASMNIHRTIYPSNTAENWDVSFYASSDDEISPFFHDFYFVDNSLRGFGIFGLKSEGLSSALMTTIAKSLIYRLFSRMYTMPLEKISKSINTLINEEIGEKDSISGKIIKLEDFTAEYSDTGFGKLVLIRDGVAENISDTAENQVKNIAFGIDGYSTEFPIRSISLNKGDVLLLYSSENGNESEISGELTKFLAVATDSSSTSPQNIVNRTAGILSGQVNAAADKLQKTVIIAVRRN